MNEEEFEACRKEFELSFKKTSHDFTIDCLALVDFLKTRSKSPIYGAFLCHMVEYTIMGEIKLKLKDD
jgi:hypothetical protein